MRHPLATNKNYIIYLLIWAVIIAAHIAVLYFYFGFPRNIAIADSLVFNGHVALFGFAFGFAFYYLKTDSTAINTLVSYLALILVGVIGAYFGSNFILSKVFSSHAEYSSFLSDARLWRISASAFYIAAILVAYYFVLYNYELHERKETEHKLQHLLKQTELDALKSQINPHFIFNSLNSISSLTIISPERAQEMVIKLSDFLRYSLGNNVHPLSSLKEELNNIALYLDIEKVRFGDRLEVTEAISEEAKKAMLPNMILQPLFENAIKYGLYETFDDVKIITEAKLNDGVLRISIINSFDPTNTVKKGKGIGLQNVQERLRLHYGSGQLVKISKEGNQFKATLEIPQKHD